MSIPNIPITPIIPTFTCITQFVSITPDTVIIMSEACLLFLITDIVVTNIGQV